MEKRSFDLAFSRRHFGVRICTLVLLVGIATPIHSAELTIVDSPEQLFEMIRGDSDLTVVNFWATWCKPCVEEMPDLAKVSREFEGRGVRMVGITLDDAISGDRSKKVDKVHRFLETAGTPYRNFYFAGDTATLIAFWSISGSLPTTLILDASGIVILSLDGPVTSSGLARKLRNLLGD